MQQNKECKHHIKGKNNTLLFSCLTITTDLLSQLIFYRAAGKNVMFTSQVWSQLSSLLSWNSECIVPFFLYNLLSLAHIHRELQFTVTHTLSLTHTYKQAQLSDLRIWQLLCTLWQHTLHLDSTWKYSDSSTLYTLRVHCTPWQYMHTGVASQHSRSAAAMQALIYTPSLQKSEGWISHCLY